MSANSGRARGEAIAPPNDAARASALSGAGAETRWYLVQTQAGREAFAADHLRRQHYTPFVPTTWRSIRHARKIRTVRAAFFPGYLFVPLDLTRDRWRPIDGTFGVVQIVKAGAAPLPAPRGLVETLIAASGEDGVLDRTGGSLKAGHEVRVIRGPFADQIAVVEAMQGPDRVRVLLSIMRQAVPVTLTRSDLAVV